VGFLAARFRKNSSYINWFGVLKKRKRLGVGKRLVKRWEQWAKKKGAKYLSASTYKKENVSFYEKLGFYVKRERVGIIKLPQFMLKKEI
jgi:GNAT superfamily N-acetyltransferase